MAKPDTGRDAGAKRRAYDGPAIFSFGFRPFFLGATLFAGMAVPLWMAAFAHGYALGPAGDALAWHAHEMIFGFLAAVIGGFLLTAIPNWTGRAPVMGLPLTALFALWLAGRIAMLSLEPGLAGRLIDGAFLVMLAASSWREVVVGANWRNVPVCVLLSLFTIANLLWHADALGLVALPPGTAHRLALGVVTLLMSLIGGRIIPSFTTNWMKREQLRPEPVPFNAYDKAVIAVTAVVMGGWLFAPASPVTAALLLVGGTMHAIRLTRWRGLRTVREPLVLVLHVAYAWIAVAMLLMGIDILQPGMLGGASAMHALTAGAIGLLTVAVMTRASLGHSGRELAAGRTTVAIYLLVFAGAALRILLPLTPLDYALGASIAGTVWAFGMLLFAAGYGPMLMTRRR